MVSGTGRALFERVVGARFAMLPEAVRALHKVDGLMLCEGRCRVTRGTGVLARMMAGLLALPQAGEDQPTQVTKRREGERERWIRTIGGTQFGSTIRASGPERIVEQIGFIAFQFALEGDATGLDWQMLSVRVFGIPVPSWLRPRIAARESDHQGHFHFEVSAVLPAIGLLIAYSGTLQVVEALDLPP